MKRRMYLWAMVLLLVPVLGCGLTNRIRDLVSSQASKVESPAELPAPTDTLPVVEDVEQVTEPTVTATEPTSADSSSSDSTPSSVEKLAFSGASKLDQLSSYRVYFSMDFDGTSGGQPSQGFIEMMIESTKEPKATHLAMEMDGSTVEQLGGGNNIEFYDVGGTVYMFSDAAGGEWISIPSTDDEAFSSGFFAPDEDLELPKTAACDSQPEEINGISATHCFFDEGDIESADATFERLEGHVWVAVDGDYIVRYEVNADGYQSLSQEEGDLFDFGSVSFVYQLSEVNVDFAITPPTDALNSQSLDFGTAADDDAEAPDVPMLADATELFSVEGITTYYTQAAVAEVVDFYRQELAIAGWVEDVEGAFVDEKTALLSFEKDSSNLTLTVNKEPDGRVNIGLITLEP